MKKVLAATLVLAALTFTPTFALAQADHMSHADRVEIVARHCQNYTTYFQDGKDAPYQVVVDQIGCAADPSTVYSREVTHNLDTNLAKDWSAFLMSGTSGLPTAGLGNYLALSVSGTVAAADCPASATPASSNCNMNGGASPGTYEISTSGLARHQATFARTGNGVYTLTYTWTAGAAQDVSHGTPNGTIASAGVATGGTAGTGPILFENTFTPVSMAIADTLQITWTITIT